METLPLETMHRRGAELAVPKSQPHRNPWENAALHCLGHNFAPEFLDPSPTSPLALRVTKAGAEQGGFLKLSLLAHF